MVHRRDTRERLVHAAADLFWARGYEAASLADIAREASVPVGNVFYHFRAKSDLGRAVAGLFVAEAAAALAGIERRHGEPRARIGAFVDLLAESTASRVARGCPIARAAREFPREAGEAGAAAVFALMGAWLEAQLAGAGAADPPAVARSALARWQGAIVLASALGDATVLTGEIEALRRDLARA
ncbi:TetR/AcrR family transcriptional regulator [Prosthecomicrobium sp. N25]|uniref:TetR/AcrR family transcriptional regulator n=1 Tax=Prosthecomicrobium sp. N25 TaxID=3129254 RepID=UPI0030787575